MQTHLPGHRHREAPGHTCLRVAHVTQHQHLLQLLLVQEDVAQRVFVIEFLDIKRWKGQGTGQWHRLNVRGGLTGLMPERAGLGAPGKGLSGAIGGPAPSAPHSGRSSGQCPGARSDSPILLHSLCVCLGAPPGDARGHSWLHSGITPGSVPETLWDLPPARSLSCCSASLVSPAPAPHRCCSASH